MMILRSVHRVPLLLSSAATDRRPCADTARAQWHARRARAFTLIEMLVVIGIIGLLIVIALMLGQSVITNAKVQETRAMMTQLDNAVKAFADDSPHASITQAVQRYGPYPPDDLMAFTPQAPTGAGHGLGGAYQSLPNLMPGGMGRYWNQSAAMPLLTDHIEDPDNYVPNGDIKALVWSLRSRSESRVLYESISDRFRVSVSTDQEFFDMNESGSVEGMIDKEVHYLVDSWGNPLSYYAASGVAMQETLLSATSHGWVAAKLVEANKNLPVLMSYGPNGEVQLDSRQTLEEQYLAAISGDNVFDKTLNEDNIYSDDALGDRLVEIVKP